MARSCLPQKEFILFKMDQNRQSFQEDMNTLAIETKSPKQTKQFAKKIAKLLKSGDVVLLIGQLGTGKTTFAQAVAEELGVSGFVRSPSFTLINEYQGKVKFFHIDLYRLNTPEEIFDLGCEEYLFSDGVCLIEWGEKIENLFPFDSLRIKLEHINKLQGD